MEGMEGHPTSHSRAHWKDDGTMEKIWKVWKATQQVILGMFSFLAMFK